MNFQVTFECKYDTTVKVASQDLTVNEATAIGATSARGSLVEGFGLSLWTDSDMSNAVTDDNLYIGSLKKYLSYCSFFISDLSCQELEFNLRINNVKYKIL